VIASANQLEKQVLDLETGERGFMLTRRERFLEPWQSAGRHLPAGTGRLERLVAGDPDQEQRVRGLARATHSYYVAWSVPIVRLARRHPAAATAKVSGGEGKRRVDAIRGRLDRLIATERYLLNHRRNAATASGRRAVFLGLGGIIASVLLILAFTAYLARQIVVPLRRSVSAAREVAAGNLPARVPEGGPGELGVLAEAFNSMAGSLEANHEQLAAHNAELARRAGINHAVLEATSEAIVLFDPTGKPVLTNPAGSVPSSWPLSRTSCGRRCRASSATRS
jgi:CHASE3 domain sensor protein